MRAVIQRVSESSVAVNQQKIASIQKGLLILLGIEAADSYEDIDWLCRKIAKMRIFSDEQNAMNLSLQDIDGEAIVVSQFTLYASTKKGNRPSFIKAAKPEIAIPIYESFIENLQKYLNQPVQSGVFGADMKVHLVNDGPVTIVIDTKEKE
ncbi:MAG: D-aminoacyl-tRNA deacylase [Bacteroidota bacterium]